MIDVPARTLQQKIPDFIFNRRKTGFRELVVQETTNFEIN